MEQRFLGTSRLLGQQLHPVGQYASASRRSMGALPSSGQWVRLEVPASQVGLEGSTLSGMAFTTYNGRATWDNSGKATTSIVTNVVRWRQKRSNTNSSGGSTNVVGGGGTSTNSNGGSTNIITGTNDVSDTNIISGTNSSGIATNIIPGLSAIDDATLAMPAVGTNGLHILSPTMLEVTYINTKAARPGLRFELEPGGWQRQRRDPIRGRVHGDRERPNRRRLLRLALNAIHSTRRSGSTTIASRTRCICNWLRRSLITKRLK